MSLEIAEEENVLEIALRLAVQEPASRPDFFKLLLKSNVFMPCSVDRTSQSNGLTEARDKISIPHWNMKNGSRIIPFFTSLSAMRHAVKEETGSVVMPTKKLFEMTKGDTLILNPELTYSKEFLPREIEKLLEHGTNHLPKAHIIGKGTHVHISEPANVPTKMFDSLKKLFKNRSQVEAAYWIFIDDKSYDEKPCFVVGIDAEGDIQQIINEASSVATDTSIDDVPVDFIHVIPWDARFSEFLSKACKFYERS